MMNSFPQKSKNKSTTIAHSIKQRNQTPCPSLIPYGAIPKYKKDKRRRKALSSQKKNHNQEQLPSVLAPYPFFQLALSSSPSFLTSLAHKWFINPTLQKKTSKLAASAENENHSTLSPVGFMPRALPPTTDMAYSSSLKVSAPMEIHNHVYDHQQEASSSLSSFSSSASSSSSLEDTWSFNTNDTWNDSGTLAKETDYSTSSHYYSSTNSKTASTLSGLLCEHYVQSQLMIMTMMDYDASDDTDVENDADGCPMTCPSLTPTSTSNTSASSTSSSTSTTDSSLLDTLIYPFSSSPYTFDNKIFDITTTDPSATISSSASSNKDSPNETSPIDVPLSTFRMFRARDDENDNDKENIAWNENNCNDYDDTMKNNACFGPCDDDHHSQCDEKKKRTNGTISTITEEMHQHQNDMVYSGKEALLENSWANWQKAWQGKQWVLSMSEQDEKKDDCLPRTSSPDEDQREVVNPNPTPSSVPPSPIALNKSREPRVNSAHLRMLVAEVNMMRADKIVGPLRPRNYLPKRNDPIPSTHCRLSPSPLSFNFVSV